jgi:FkbM family methyltransferase
METYRETQKHSSYLSFRRERLRHVPRAPVMKNDLVYDIGGFDGSDTAHYLSLGFRVLCIEADPVQAHKITLRFAGDDRVTVLNVAVGSADGVTPFYVQPYGALSSLEERPGSTRIDVPVRTMDSIIAVHGAPYFMKVDIEGADRYAVLPLTPEIAPKYLSFEAGKRDLDLILHAHAIGYKRFNIIRQDTQATVSLPAMSVRWTARQRFRLWLRQRKALHALARYVRSGAIGKAAGVATGMGDHPTSGPAPMERKEGWREIDELLRDWSALVASGMIDSAWFDVHAQI